MKRAGSKSRLVQHLLPHIAAVPHTCFVEPFCGTCSVLMGKPRSKVEVVNDTDGALVNALRQIQHHPAELKRELRWAINSRAELHARRAQPGLTEIQRAASYLFLNNISFGGDCQSFGVSRRSAGGGAVTPLSRIFRQAASLHARLERVAIEQLDWERCLALYDTPETLFFCDPPYVGGSVKAYAAWTNEDVARFHAALAKLQGRWIVTLNDSPEVRAIFAGCTFTAFSRQRSISNTRADTRQTYREIVITPALSNLKSPI